MDMSLGEAASGDGSCIATLEELPLRPSRDVVPRDRVLEEPPLVVGRVPRVAILKEPARVAIVEEPPRVVEEPPRVVDDPPRVVAARPPGVTVPLLRVAPPRAVFPLDFLVFGMIESTNNSRSARLSGTR